MSMLEWIIEKKQQNVILFVHGLKGGMETWAYDKNISFPVLLSEDVAIHDSYDVACFNYFTTFTNIYGKAKSWTAKLFQSTKKSRKNLPIKEIAELLSTEIQVNLNEYQNIIIIAHSMGGLVSKACILKHLEENQFTPVKGFISLAVPHSGAKLANIGGLISSNIQIKDLGLLSNIIDELTRDWLHASNTPEAKYLYAANDQYVDKKSALAIDSTKQDSMAVDEDHSSICKPKNDQETVYRAVLGHIKHFESFFIIHGEIKDFVDIKQYDDEYFVLKLAIADVHKRITGHAKEYFYNAELIRKIFTSEVDKKILDDLYKRIKYIYQEEYEIYISEDKKSDQLVTAVHRRIMKEDRGYLKALLKGIDNINKKGMLHQLANIRDDTILWSDESYIDKNKEV